MKKGKPKVLCVCAKGLNRSKYLANYLRNKGYKIKYGGVEPFENPAFRWNPISQKDIEWADTIILVKKRLKKLIKDKFKIKNKKVIVLDVTDSKRLLPEEYAYLKNRSNEEFNKKWRRPQLRKAIKPYLPLKLK